MGAGRATSAQMEAFRRQESSRATCEGRSAGYFCRSLWMSATLAPEWLATVDHPVPTKLFRVDPVTEADERLRKLVEAPKHVRRVANGPTSGAAKDQKGYIARLAASVLEAHRSGRMTLVIVNQVKRAQDMYAQVRKTFAARQGVSPELVLLHSRFRPTDRDREMAKLVGTAERSDIIVIATQAVEAGVDISAAVMFAELAPWASMVQRFGRANRRAEVEDGAHVYWIDLLGSIRGNERKVEKDTKTVSLPYEADQLWDARAKLAQLEDVAPVHLPPPGKIDPPLCVIRRKDLDDLFDTDADLTGFDVDISPYVRDADDTDIRVFWRDASASGDAPPKPTARELCAIPIGQARSWLKSTKKALGPVFFVRDPQWRRPRGRIESSPPGWAFLHDSPWPGLTVLADRSAGGYDDTLGFTGNRRDVPAPIDFLDEAPDSQHMTRVSQGPEEESDGHDDDPRSETGHPVQLTDHLRHVVSEVYALCEGLGVDDSTSDLLVRAALWHDLGKAHEVFQETMRKGLKDVSVSSSVLLAKTVKRNLRHRRAYFRHELASALAFLAHQGWSQDADLCAFLIAAHHGKVRMNLRALPREAAPKEPERAGSRFARGVWEGDELPPLDLGVTERWPGGKLTLSIMELGWDKTSRESWTERTRKLLSTYGPFRLAWLETLLRLADWRASGKESSGSYIDV